MNMNNNVNVNGNELCKYLSIAVLLGVFGYLIHILMPIRLDWIGKGYPDGKHGDYNPKDRYKDVVNEFGEPDYVQSKRGGMAIWSDSTLKSRGHCWDQVLMLDEQIPHEKPGPHVDFLYSWYSLYVPDDKVNDVRDISESITYDPLKRQVRGRCHFMGANAATVLLAKRVATGEMSIKDAKDNYGPYIMKTIKAHKTYDSNAYKSYIKELCDYHKEQEKKGYFKVRH